MMSAPAELCLLACLFLGAGFSLASGASQMQDFTFVLPAGRAECFYQTAAKSDSVEVNYQVLAGTGLDVRFTFLSPRGDPLALDLHKSDGIHIVEATEDGDYEFCFDNSFSQMSHKMVFFVVTVNSQSSVGGDGGGWADVAETETLADYRLEDIRAKMDSVHRNLESSRQAQASLRAFETRDRYLLEDNLWRVSFWSCVNLLVMLAVAVTQIYTLRRLFDDKKRIHT